MSASRNDLRWFGGTALLRLVVPGLQGAGLRIATEGWDSAGVAVCMSSRHLTEAWHWAHGYRAPLVYYHWDIPPWRLESGGPDPVVDVAGRLLTIPVPFRRFSRRPGHYSRVLHVLKRARSVWVASASIADQVREVARREPVRVPYCYDSTRFFPGSALRDPDLIVTVSRLVPYKGQRDLLRAAALLSWRPKVRIFGRGQDEAPLRALAASLGVHCTVEHGRSDDEIVEAYRTAGIVACPSHFEGFGLTGIEALACAAPVVASDIPPHREFLGDHVTYHRPKDPAALAAAIDVARAAPTLNTPPAALRALSIGSAVERFLGALTPLLGPNG